MDLSHLQIVGAIVGATIAAGYSSIRSHRSARDVHRQVSPNVPPNGLAETRTLRQMVTEILHMQNRLADELAQHDDRASATNDHLTRVERKLDAHLAGDDRQ